ncbi:DUF962 domain-containing protein [Dokdonella soli]|uniref:DUF962 domain-containing protein n=1 Tax=Dokdonella soli TaxID=529810 RepID=A0ABP3THK0_9GAMM
MSRYANFRAFYPFYLSEHSNRNCRRMHFVGSTLVLATVAAAVLMHDARWLWLAPLFGYGFAWIGHFAFEKNRPATFQQPFYSLAGDWVMYWDILRGRVRL